MQPSWDELLPYSKLVNTEGMEPRAYQINIAKSVFGGKSTLVVLPTGLGKTMIAVLAIAKALHSGKRALFLAPTKPLSEQHFATLSRLLNIEKSMMLLLTGSIQPAKRAELEANSRVIVGTPQTVANDLSRGALSLENFGVVVFDECHRAVGKYAYTYIANECKARGIQLLGMTASPGGDKKRISALIDALGIENIEIRSSSDIDVEPYVMQKDMHVIYVEKSPTIDAIAGLLKPVINEHLSNLYTHGLSPFKYFDNMPKGRLIEIGNNIAKIQATNYKYMALNNYSYVLHLNHAYDLVTTETIYSFIKYFEALKERSEQSRNVRNILANGNVSSALALAKKAIENNEEHPKVETLVGLLNNGLKGKSVIVFGQYRTTIKRIAEILRANGIDARAFMGKKEGITQEAQSAVLEDFRNNKFRVLVATSIGEEGLDIPAVDSVVFYEPIPSEIRNIQRRGRAGRLKYGSVFILAALKTRDEAYLMISRIREKRMRDILMQMKEKLALGIRPEEKQKRLA
ncbi:MAG: DEAD/DEAH box helicase [Candidatus Micrarchaeia archaeon]